ncbi:MAG TPA: hypothetical protein PLR25_22630 [Planctomycetaceae bacterium]|nr:hypothetical protein [Planctomycetaceae bacterium]
MACSVFGHRKIQRPQPKLIDSPAMSGTVAGWSVRFKSAAGALLKVRLRRHAATWVGSFLDCLGDPATGSLVT